MKKRDLVIIGAGPAGMAAATVAAAHGVRPLVLDEQATPGGQLYRAIEGTADRPRPELGASYAEGLTLARAFRDGTVEYVPGSVVWQVSKEREVGYSHDGAAHLLEAEEVIIAGGAQERPVPIPGWTLNGVMTVGGTQVLLKESGLAMSGAVFAGTGPLLYLAVHQYLEAGVPVQAVLDLTPRGNYVRALRYLPGALTGLAKIAEGVGWKRRIAASGVPLLGGVEELRALGESDVVGVEFRRGGRTERLDCTHLLLHLGVVPNVNLSMAAGCEARWDERQACWTIAVDAWFTTSVPGIRVAGDGATISGGAAAVLAGRLAALGALERLGRIGTADRDRLAAPWRRGFAAERRLRPFLEALFRPEDRFRIPAADDTVVCRCEEITVRQVREAVATGCAGPNQLKSYTRCGMGPCQGRFCGLTVSELIGRITDTPVADVGYYRLRPPVKPLLLRELTQLAETDTG